MIEIRKNKKNGFTIPEVIVAGSILIILCVGTLTAFSYAIKINRGNNLRMQALSVLQLEVEDYRAMKFVPGLETVDDLNRHRPVHLRSGNHTRDPRNSADEIPFTITTTVTNIDGLPEERTKFKEITIRARPQNPESGWLSELKTEVTVQRVRSN